jgi:hypothetical protein
MALGNGNPKEGDKGSNFFWELKVLQGLEAIAVAIEAGGGGGGGGGGITALTGDVTAGPGSGSVIATIGALKVTTPKIAANAVTFAKMQLISNFRFLGYADSNPGAPNPGAITELPLANIPYFSSGITGVANNATFLRGDGSWTTPASFTIQNYRNSLTARSFVNFEGTLNAIDEGAGPNRVTITGPTTADGITTNYNADNTAPNFRIGSPLSYPQAPVATSSPFTSDRFINTRRNKLAIVKDTNLPTTGLSFTATVVGGQVTAVAIIDPGTSSYFSSVVADNTIYGSYTLTFTGGSPTVAATGSLRIGSSITEVIVTNGGSNYTIATTATFPTAPVNGTQALGTPIIKNGIIVGVNITNPGSGYGNTAGAPIFGNVTFTDVGGGAGATAKYSATNGVAFFVNITNPGSGYVSAPAVSVSPIAGNEYGALEITGSREDNAGTNSPLLRAAGNTPNGIGIINTVNYGNGASIWSQPIGGGVSFESSHTAGSGIGVRISSPGTGVTISGHTSNAVFASTSTTNVKGINVQNSSTTSTQGVLLLQMGGTPSATTLKQEIATLIRNNITVDVVAPTVPNNSTNQDGVGTYINYDNPLYNIPRPDPAAGTYVGSITGSTLTVTSVTTGVVNISQRISGGTIAPNTYITAQTGGTPNGPGTYTINPPAAAPIASLTISGNGEIFSRQPSSTQIYGIWRDANHDTAIGGLDITLSKADPSNDPRRRIYNHRTVLRLDANGQVTLPQGLPTSATGLVAGDFYTQTATQLGGSGTQKVICIV